MKIIKIKPGQEAACNVTSTHKPVTAEAHVHFLTVPAADLVHFPGVSMLPSYPAGAVQDDASLGPNVCTVLHTLAPYVGVPSGCHCGFSTSTLSKHVYFYNL
jgi:hypothetical protein